MWFYFVVLASFIINCNSEFTRISKLNVLFILWQILWQFNNNIFLCSLACESWSWKSGYSPCPDWSRVGIRDSQVESGHSCLIWDSWTLCMGFREVREHAPRVKIKNLRSSNCWKCIEIANPTTTTFFLYHFKSFTIPSGGPFWLLGGGGVHPPCLRACDNLIKLLKSAVCPHQRPGMHQPGPEAALHAERHINRRSSTDKGSCIKAQPVR